MVAAKKQPGTEQIQNQQIRQHGLIFSAKNKSLCLNIPHSRTMRPQLGMPVMRMLVHLPRDRIVKPPQVLA